MPQRHPRPGRPRSRGPGGRLPSALLGPDGGAHESMLSDSRAKLMT
jgi:hypothetical protein